MSSTFTFSSSAFEIDDVHQLTNEEISSATKDLLNLYDVDDDKSLILWITLSAKFPIMGILTH